MDSLIWRVHGYPKALVDAVVYSIPESVIMNESSTFCDLAFGGGQFLLGILNRCIATGQSREQILPRLYGLERSNFYLNYAVWTNKLGGAQLSRCANVLEWDPQMEFDVIVGNPPYQGGDLGNSVYKSLWPLFWKKSFDLLKPGGIISLITPATWCSPTSDLAKKHAISGMTRLWDVFNSFTSRADVTDVKGYFPGVGSTFSAVTVDTSGNEGLTFSNGYDPSLGFYPLSGEKEVEQELSLTDNIGSRCKVEGKIREGVRVSLLKSRKIDEVNVEVCESMEVPKTGANPTLYAHVYCGSREEAEFVRQRILDCRDILYRHCRYNGFIDLKILGMVSLAKTEVMA